MNTTVIMLVMFLNITLPGPRLEAQEFSNLENCHAASKSIQKVFKDDVTIYCVTK